MPDDQGSNTGTYSALGELLRVQQATARVVGALAHELNNPLQGVTSLLSVFGGELAGDEHSRSRLEQIRHGIARLAQIVESAGVVYENLPRPPDHTAARFLTDALAEAFSERHLRVDWGELPPRDVALYCLMPELVRLLTETSAIMDGADHVLRVSGQLADEHVILNFERDSEDVAPSEPWRRLDAMTQASGLYVLVDEMTRLGSGEAEFRFDNVGVCGIRLWLRTQMTQARGA